MNITDYIVLYNEKEEVFSRFSLVLKYKILHYKLVKPLNIYQYYNSIGGISNPNSPMLRTLLKKNSLITDCGKS